MSHQSTFVSGLYWDDANKVLRCSYGYNALIYPKCSNTVSYKYNDNSIRVINENGDTTVAFEDSHTADIAKNNNICSLVVTEEISHFPQFLICGTEDARLVIYEMTRNPFSNGGGNQPSGHNNRSPYRLKRRCTFYTHKEEVTCLSFSPEYKFTLSGSTDGYAIIWDMTRMCFVARLPRHPYQVSAVAIDSANGDLATCSRHMLYVWDCNGRPLASIDTSLNNPHHLNSPPINHLENNDFSPAQAPSSSGNNHSYQSSSSPRLRANPPNNVNAGCESSDSEGKDWVTSVTFTCASDRYH